MKPSDERGGYTIAFYELNYFAEVFGSKINAIYIIGYAFLSGAGPYRIKTFDPQDIMKCLRAPTTEMTFQTSVNRNDIQSINIGIISIENVRGPVADLSNLHHI